jgi:hypothetical protein
MVLRIGVAMMKVLPFAATLKELSSRRIVSGEHTGTT